MGRTSLVVGRKVSVVICALFVLRCTVLLGAIIFFVYVEGGRDPIVGLLRAIDGIAPGADWHPWDFVIKQIFYLFCTAGSGLAAIHFRRRIEAMDAFRDS